jgi:hypothetical protein
MIVPIISSPHNLYKPFYFNHIKSYNLVEFIAVLRGEFTSNKTEAALYWDPQTAELPKRSRFSTNPSPHSAARIIRKGSQARILEEQRAASTDPKTSAAVEKSILRILLSEMVLQNITRGLK